MSAVASTGFQTEIKIRGVPSAFLFIERFDYAEVTRGKVADKLLMYAIIVSAFAEAENIPYIILIAIYVCSQVISLAVLIKKFRLKNYPFNEHIFSGAYKFAEVINNSTGTGCSLKRLRSYNLVDGIHRIVNHKPLLIV